MKVEEGRVWGGKDADSNVLFEGRTPRNLVVKIIVS